jgi:hypothetical protein
VNAVPSTSTRLGSVDDRALGHSINKPGIPTKDFKCSPLPSESSAVWYSAKSQLDSSSPHKHVSRSLTAPKTAQAAQSTNNSTRTLQHSTLRLHPPSPLIQSFTCATESTSSSKPSSPSPANPMQSCEQLSISTAPPMTHICRSSHSKLTIYDYFTCNRKQLSSEADVNKVSWILCCFGA